MGIDVAVGVEVLVATIKLGAGEMVIVDVFDEGIVVEAKDKGVEVVTGGTGPINATLLFTTLFTTLT